MRIGVFLFFLALSVVLTLVTRQLFFFFVLPFAFAWPRRRPPPADPAGGDVPP